MRRTLLPSILLALIPGAALAHAAERGLILLLPTGHYLAAGAAAVALTFLLLALAPRMGGWIARSGPGLSCPAPGLAAGCQALGVTLFWGLIAAGWLGARDPLGNPLPLVIWTLWWIGFTLASAVLGDMWRAINPWSAPVALVRSLTGPPPLRLPGAFGYAPAIAGFLAFAWFEIVSLAPADPARLAQAAALYWLVQFLAMCLVGEPVWRRRGEAFSVIFRLVARLAPLGRRLTWPGGRLVGTAAPGRFGWLFITAVIAGVTFDGLSGTFFWLGLIGVNPLEFPGRSAVVTENTLGLLAVWTAMSGAFALAVVAGWHLAGRTAPLRQSLARLALSLIPIALAYHFAHYLTVLLVNGQYALVALSDPFATGTDWLGTADRPVATGFLSDLASVETIWNAQSAGIVIGHLLAVLTAHAIALDLWPTPRRAALSQIPLAALMVGYTLLGLWLLSTPTGA